MSRKLTHIEQRSNVQINIVNDKTYISLDLYIYEMLEITTTTITIDL